MRFQFEVASRWPLRSRRSLHYSIRVSTASHIHGRSLVCRSTWRTIPNTLKLLLSTLFVSMVMITTCALASRSHSITREINASKQVEPKSLSQNGYGLGHLVVILASFWDQFGICLIPLVSVQSHFGSSNLVPPTLLTSATGPSIADAGHRPRS